MKLNSISLSVPTEENLQNQFQIESGSKTLLRLYVNSGQLRDACVDEIQAAIDKYNEARKTLAVSEDVKEKIMMSMMSVEDVGDVKPVIFPNDLADYCQVKHLSLAPTGALCVTIYKPRLFSLSQTGNADHFYMYQ